MKIFLDTANIEDIRKYNDMGLLDGITTNPSLLAKEGGDPHAAMEEITRIIKGDVSLEVVSTDYDGMIEEGKKLREYGDHVVVKCPMTGDGLKACKSFSAASRAIFTVIPVAAIVQSFPSLSVIPFPISNS